jgi:putative PIN family toxin of toxin-antitoxin system
MKLVIDTNVIVSAIMNPNRNIAGIITLIFSDEHILLFDGRILFEYIAVLSRKEFSFSTEIINDFIDYVKKAGEYVSAEISVKEFTDETDKKFYEVYKSGDAKYLITGNKKHFPVENGIVTPKEFLEREFGPK